jgi:ADP-heptose:LPS heptosyltransferase
MNKTIIISPYSQKLRNGKTPNPKDYPYWKEVIHQLHDLKYNTIQIGVQGEAPLGCHQFHQNLSLDQLKITLDTAVTWASVDNFFHHFAALHKKPGVAIFGKSDPTIFGHSQNINLLKDRVFLRAQQFDIWETEEFNKDAFVLPPVVVQSVIILAKQI